MCQQATLRTVIGLVPGVYKRRPESALALLFKLLTTEYAKPSPVTKVQDPVSLVLFQEDKPNSYFEKFVLLECISLALKEIIPLINIYSSLLECIASKVKDHTTDLVQKVEEGPTLVSPWNDPCQFYTHLWTLQLLTLLRSRCADASEEERLSAVFEHVSNSEKELRMLPAVLQNSLHPLYEKQLKVILRQSI